jgi:hypothetical protein
MNYVILSDGAYSDYEATHYCGEREITQEEFNKKGEEIGDIILDWAESLPTRKAEVVYSSNKGVETYNPEDGKKVYTSDLSRKWKNKMIEWLSSQGYQEIPDNIPEINIYYSEIPNSKNRKTDY